MLYINSLVSERVNIIEARRTESVLPDSSNLQTSDVVHKITITYGEPMLRIALEFSDSNMGLITRLSLAMKKMKPRLKMKKSRSLATLH